MRSAEAAKDKDKDKDFFAAAAASAEHRRRLSESLATAASVAKGMTAEVLADMDGLEEERGVMLVPQVSALVGCQVK